MAKYSIFKNIYLSKNSKFNVLFVPGFPGGYRDRPLMDDLKALGANIYTMTYPGTNGAEGVFSLNNSEKAVESALKELSKSSLPKLIVTYSFGTLFVSPLSKFSSNTMGILFFSPIIDLKHCLKENFIEELDSLDKKEFRINKKSFESKTKNLQESWRIYAPKIALLVNENIPLIFLYGAKDQTVKSDLLYNLLYEYRSKNRFNLATQIFIENGDHHLDTIYEKNILFPILLASIFSYEVKKRYEDISAYVMGSTVNFVSRHKSSDIDLILIKENWVIKDYAFLRNLAKKYQKSFGIEFDISINMYIDCKSRGRIRSNRGPSFLLDLSKHFLPLIVNKKQNIIYSLKDVQKDSQEVNRQNLYQSYKGLMNFNSSKFSAEMVIKNFIYSCAYYQYKDKKDVNIDQNNIVNYYSGNKSIQDTLKICIEIKRHGFEGISHELLEDVVKKHQSLISNKFDVKKN